MATSRTGTRAWKATRLQALRLALNEGRTRCPLCGVAMDFERTRQPDSAEPDHIVPYSLGGSDALDNTRVICRLCNQKRGNGVKKRVRPEIETTELDASDIW